MSRYDWPPARIAPGMAPAADAPSPRAARRPAFDAEAARQTLRGAAHATPGRARAPADANRHLWQPLGPDTLLGGEVSGASRITGRVSMLAVHDGGQRVYAASANGGVWYSGDGGVHWRALDGEAATPSPAGIQRPAHRNACGAIAVHFGSGGALDTVFVGTGEAWHDPAVALERRSDAGPGQPLGGVGILVVSHDAAAGSTSWTREAANLVGSGVYRLALEPGGSRVVAATSIGLLERPTSNAGAAWDRVEGAPFASLEVDCTDVLWTAAAGPAPPRLWVWVERGVSAGLWMRATDGSGADWQRVETPGTTSRRAVLAAATSHEVWLFCDHPADTTRTAADAGTARAPRIAAAGDAARFPDVCLCWYRSSSVVRKGFVRLIETGALVPLTYNVIKGRAIFEGDIDLGPETEMAQLRAALRNTVGDRAPRAVAITGQAFRWPGGLVPWESTPGLRTLVERAIAHWESRTRIRFVERMAANGALYPNWVSFEAVDGCSSRVGMRGGKQVVSLADGCGFGAAVHEIGHALGLWHEQSRQDRDAHVRILTENIEAGKEHNFQQHVTDGDDIGPYDYASIMHYPRDAFAKNPFVDTIVAIGGQRIGQLDGLSAGDVAAIRTIYPDLQRPLLFRIANDANPVARPVLGVPDVLGGTGHYAIALAVDPSRPDRVVIAGGRRAGDPDDALIAVAPVAAAPNGQLAFGQGAAPVLLGDGVHAHVHHLAFSNGGRGLWVACDGGVYRSDRPAVAAGFAAMNDGLSVVEVNHVACHPVCEGRVVAGVQGQGVAVRGSAAAWQRTGDGAAQGGGLGFDPLQPQRYVYQLHHGRWSSSEGGFALRLPAGEDGPERCAAHSQPALAVKQRPGAPEGQRSFTQILVGTSRVWYSEDFGATWVTLPGGSAPPAGNLDHDDFGRKITACRWQGTEVAWALGEGRLKRLARTSGSDAASGPGTWTAETVIERGVKPKKDATKANGPIRDAEVWTDIAVNLDAPGTARGTRGALYLGTIGHADDEAVDTLCWFDGTERWFATGLRRNGVPAPVTSIVCDPDFPDEVWVGTTIGVWKGVRNLADPAAPSWTWSARVNGLPEAAVEDLALYSRDGLRLLRAGIASRGVWELRLDTADVADLAYLRVHEDDLRHRARASLLGRDGTTERSWHASPDVRPRRAALAVPLPASLPWAQGAPPAIDTEQLRRFQCALRARTGDPRVRATGQWDTAFNEVLRSLAAPTIAPQTVRIDKPYWDLSMAAPFATAEPWGTDRPGSADLMEFGAALEEGTANIASCTLPAGPSRVEVLVQCRGLAPMDGAGVCVALLKWIDPQTPPTSRFDDASTWPAGDVPWTAAVNEVLNSAGGTTAQPFGAGWSLAGPRQTLAGQTLDPLHPGVASFELDLSALPRHRVVLLVAVIRMGSDIALAPAPLRTLVLDQAQVAVRSLAIDGDRVDAPAVRDPFPTVAYAHELRASAAQNTRLAAAIAAVRATLTPDNRTRLDGAALLVARLTPAGPMDYAGVREAEMFFSASLLKIVLMYASFELVKQVNELAPALTATSARKFMAAVQSTFGPAIERAVGRIPKGDWRKVKFSELLAATASSGGQFRVALSTAHRDDLTKIFAEQRQRITPGRSMRRLGYSLVNRTLEAAGFLDTPTGVGLWMATDYGGWRDFHVPVSTRGGRPPRAGSSSAAMTALAMASLLTHMHRGQLVDAASSAAMRTMFEGGAAWLSDLPNRASFGFTDLAAKVGHADSGSAFVGAVKSEAAFLQRRSDNAEFVAVWQNVPDPLGAEPIYRVLDEMIRNWP